MKKLFFLNLVLVTGLSGQTVSIPSGLTDGSFHVTSGSITFAFDGANLRLSGSMTYYTTDPANPLTTSNFTVRITGPQNSTLSLNYDYTWSTGGTFSVFVAPLGSYTRQYAGIVTLVAGGDDPPVDCEIDRINYELVNDTSYPKEYMLAVLMVDKEEPQNDDLWIEDEAGPFTVGYQPGVISSNKTTIEYFPPQTHCIKKWEILEWNEEIKSWALYYSETSTTGINPEDMQLEYLDPQLISDQNEILKQILLQSQFIHKDNETQRLRIENAIKSLEDQTVSDNISIVSKLEEIRDQNWWINRNTTDVHREIQDSNSLLNQVINELQDMGEIGIDTTQLESVLESTANQQTETMNQWLVDADLQNQEVIQKIDEIKNSSGNWFQQIFDKISSIADMLLNFFDGGDFNVNENIDDFAAPETFSGIDPNDLGQDWLTDFTGRMSFQKPQNFPPVIHLMGHSVDLDFTKHHLFVSSSQWLKILLSWLSVVFLALHLQSYGEGLYRSLFVVQPARSQVDGGNVIPGVGSARAFANSVIIVTVIVTLTFAFWAYLINVANSHGFSLAAVIPPPSHSGVQYALFVFATFLPFDMWLGILGSLFLIRMAGVGLYTKIAIATKFAVG